MTFRAGSNPSKSVKKSYLSETIGFDSGAPEYRPVEMRSHQYPHPNQLGRLHQQNMVPKWFQVDPRRTWGAWAETVENLGFGQPDRMERLPFFTISSKTVISSEGIFTISTYASLCAHFEARRNDLHVDRHTTLPAYKVT